MNGYNGFLAACVPPKGSCSSVCQQALSALQKAESAVGSVTCPPKNGQPDPQCESAKSQARSMISGLRGEESNSGDTAAVSGKKAVCDGELTRNEKNANNMLGELAKALATALQAMQGSGSGSGSESPATASTSDCSLMANKDNESCKCVPPFGNPRAPGCPGAGESASVAGLGGSSSKDTGTKSTPAPSAPSADAPVTPPTGGGDASAMPASFAGGGGGGGMGGGRGADGAGKGGDAKKGTLSASVLSGEGGGGGGGGYGGYGDSSSSKSKSGSSPAGSLGRSVAGSSSGANHNVTGAGGRTNWQKIAERYSDNAPTLLRDEKQFFSTERVAPSK